MTSIVRKIDSQDQDAAVQKENANVVNRLLDGEYRFDKWLIRYSDLLSPIVVKETRQTLRGRQFVWTFGFLLLCILGWTLLSITSLMPSIYFYPSGGSLLGGYLVMLTVPALIIIPIAAFFSMSSELNSNTFEVLSISPLSSYKIVWGKVVVAGVQLMLHISALAPCIALTYLLRGVSIISLTMVFPTVIVISFTLICLGVMFATFCRTLAQTVIFLIIMLGVTLLVFYSFLDYFYYAVSSNNEMFVGLIPAATFLSSLLVLIGGYGILALLVAGASIGIAGENYSRSIRIWLSILSVTLFWFLMLVVPETETNQQEPLIFVTLAFLTLHWVVAGIFIVAEPGTVSIRAQRSLPSTLSGRLFGSLFIPGGGTGYFYVICNYAAFVFTFAILLINMHADGNSILLALTCLSYMMFYMGIFRLLIYSIPRQYCNQALSVLLFVLLLSLGNGIPYFIASYVSSFRMPVYDFYCFSSPFWTLSVFSDFPMVRTAMFLLYFLTFIIFCLNAAIASSDVTLVRVRSPEELELEKRKRAEAKAASPFDAD